jgi:hypothetical protein
LQAKTNAIVNQTVATVNFLWRGTDFHRTTRQLHEPLRLRSG